MPRILFVSGFSQGTRARDLAMEFERYGRLTRCDIPAPRHNNHNGAVYAFIEYKNERDADEAYHSMHGRHFDGYRLSVQWAKNPPSSIWRFEKKGGAPQEGSHRDRHRSRSRSPRRERRSTREDGYRRKRSPSPEEDRPNRDRNRESSVDGRGQRDSRGEYRDDKARRSRSPAARRGPPEERRRARTPNPPGSHTPPPSDYAARKDDRIDSALTPPYD